MGMSSQVVTRSGINFRVRLIVRWIPDSSFLTSGMTLRSVNINLKQRQSNLAESSYSRTRVSILGVG